MSFLTSQKKAEEAKEEAKERGKEAAERVKQTAHSTTETAEEAAQDAKERAKQASPCLPFTHLSSITLQSLQHTFPMTVLPASDRVLVYKQKAFNTTETAEEAAQYAEDRAKQASPLPLPAGLTHCSHPPCGCLWASDSACILLAKQTGYSTTGWKVCSTPKREPSRRDQVVCPCSLFGLACVADTSFLWPRACDVRAPSHKVSSLCSPPTCGCLGIFLQCLSAFHDSHHRRSQAGMQSEAIRKACSMAAASATISAWLSSSPLTHPFKGNSWGPDKHAVIDEPGLIVVST